MKTKNFLSAVLSLLLFVLIFTFESKAQEIPNESGDNNQIFVDTIETSENLLDSNEVYKQQFEELSEDGDWIKVKKSDFIKELTEETGENLQYYYSDNGEYIYVWQPYVADNNWNPYIGGRWVFSYYGWTWVSDYAWGWGPYNYGRWYSSSYYGWVWLPGNVWAANWVSWRDCGGYYAWYPTCPSIYWYSYGNGYCGNTLYSYSPHNWVVVKYSDVTKRIDEKVVGDPVDNVNILNNSTKMDISTYTDKETKDFKYTGPDVKQVTKESGEVITPKYVSINTTKSGKYDEGVNYTSTKNSVTKSDLNNPVTTKNENVKSTNDPNTKNTNTKYPNTKSTNTTKSPNTKSTNTTKSPNTKSTNSTKSPNTKSTNIKKFSPPKNNGTKTESPEKIQKPGNNGKKENNGTKNSGNIKNNNTKKDNGQNKVKSNSSNTNSNKGKSNNRSGKSNSRKRN